MCCPLRVRASILRATLAFLALCTSAACTGGSTETGAAGTSGANAPVGIEVSQTYITVENRAGVPLVDGQIEIIQVGVLPRYRTTFPRLEVSASRDFTLNTFRGADGTPFNRNIARPRRVKVTAKDLAGKTFEQEVPWP